MKQESQNIIDLAGGPARINEQIDSQFEKAKRCNQDLMCIKTELQWALRLSYMLSDIGKGTVKVYRAVHHFLTLGNTDVKLKILSEMGNLETNPLARNWYLQEMNVVRDGAKPISTPKMQTTLVKDHTIDNILRTMETRINPLMALTDYAGKN